MSPAPSAFRRPASSILAIAGAVAGGVLFALTLQSAGPGAVLAQIRQIGLGFVLVLLLSGVRMAVRSKAWALCADEPATFSLANAARAFVMGDALGNVTPLGPIASEGAKAVLSRRFLPATDAVASVVLENIFYSISVAVMVSVGTLAFLMGFRLTQGAMEVTIGVSVAAVIAVLLVWWVLRTQPRVLSRLLSHDAVRTAEDRVFQFSTAHRDRLGRILLLEFTFHAAAVLEIYVLLRLLIGNSGRTLLLALVLETVERVITIAFKFVPLRLGVDQAGSGLVAGLLGIGSAAGITIATVRTARNLFWAAVGLVLLFSSGLSMKAVLRER